MQELEQRVLEADQRAESAEKQVEEEFSTLSTPPLLQLIPLFTLMAHIWDP